MDDTWGKQPGGDRAAVGEGGDGLVRVELDDTGRVRDVVFDSAVRSLPLAQVSAAVIEAFQQAQDAARAAAERSGEQLYGGLPSRDRLEAATTEAQAMAERRFEEISTALYELNRRAGGSW